jgi:hypothetical protein
VCNCDAGIRALRENISEIESGLPTIELIKKIRTKSYSFYLVFQKLGIET